MELRNQPVQGADVVMETEGHIGSCANASGNRTLRSQSPSACQYVHRTGPGRPSRRPLGPGEEGQGHTLTMHDTRESDNGIVCAWQHTSQAGSSPARPGATGRYPKVGVMPHWPKLEAGMEKPTRARRRKLETAKADLEPPRPQLWRAGRPPRGGV